MTSATEVIVNLPFYPIIGKSRAHALHKILGGLGLKHEQHYAIAAYAINLPFPLSSLSILNEQEAREVWALLLELYGQEAREVGAKVKAQHVSAA